jgi:thiol-disulfide isomerase/thioredoxin
VFRKVPEELQIHSASGSFFTIFSFVLMFFLMYSHWQSYQYAGTRQYIEMDSHQEDLLRLNFNISLLNIPCQHASVDMADHMGQQFVNITRHVRHFRLVTSKTNGNTIRSDEIIMKEENFPIWGSVSRQTHAGIHYSMPLTTKNFDDFMQKYELVLVNYYTPWCPYCKQLNPEWEKVAAQLRDHPEYSERVTLASVDCTDPQAVWLCRRAHIRAFPSMLVCMFLYVF